MHATQSAVFDQIETSPLTRRQRGLITAAVLGTMLEFFDFFIVAFVLSMIAGPWNLTFGQSAFLLTSAGAGAIVGSIVFGAMADRIGRRKVFLATLLTFSLATGSLALVPDGDWVLFGLLRVVVGLGVGGLVAVDVPLVQEFVPSSRRGFLGGLVVVFIPLGSLLGGVVTATLGEAIGWRGLVLIGLLPALISLYVRVAVKESPSWLLRQGRPDEAREAVGWVLGIDPKDVTLPHAAPSAYPRTRWRDMFAYRRSVCFTWINSFACQVAFYGVILWGPSLLVLQLEITPGQAALMFSFVSLAGFVGRLLGSRASDRFGRRSTGTVGMSVAAIALVMAGLGADVMIGPVPFFYAALLLAWFFLDGVFAVALPYWAEMFPTHMRTTGVGTAYGIGGLGKILGPAALVLISGSGTVVTPEATSAAILPAFLFFAAFAAVAAISYAVLGIETRGLSLDELDRVLEQQVTSEQGGPAVEPAQTAMESGSAR